MPITRAAIPIALKSLTALAPLAALALLIYAAVPRDAAAQTITDYDTDDNGLIEISNLDQLNAVRWDLNGDGIVAAANTTTYAAAFPNHDDSTTTPMGCPAACTGYELMQNLNFTHDSTGATITNPYPNWQRIGGAYTAQFHGNGHTISNLTITGGSNAGLFHTLGNGGGIHDVGLIAPSVSGTSRVGALVSEINTGGTVSASYATGGTTTSQGQNTYAGGLVGRNQGAIRASYAYAAVTAGAGGDQLLGPLVGLNDSAGRISASYAVGTASGGTGQSYRGGLVGRNTGVAENSYCNTTVHSPCLGGSGVTAADKTAAQLQTPTGYTGIYALWNVDGSGDTFPDQPWDFGTTTTYPRLKTPAQRAMDPVIDYDQDDDNLIDITTQAQLAAIHYDMTGDGLPENAVNYPAYAAPGVFLGGDLAATATRMGCPSGCRGYELLTNLDLASTTNWTPIGVNPGYSAEFNGNGRTISNLTATGGFYGGLFRNLAVGGAIRNVGIINPTISSSFSAGGLIAYTDGGTEITASYVTGGTVTHVGGNVIQNVGGLVAWHGGDIRASYASTTVSAGAVTNVNVGGLAGSANANSSITASYANGPVAGTGGGANVGGLVGNVASANSTITDSYCDATVFGTTTNPCLGAGTATAPGYTTAQLQEPTGYNGIYANWNLDLDADLFPDNPWNFGATTTYLAIIPPDDRIIDHDANDNNLIDVDTLHQLNAIRHDLNGDGLPAATSSYVAYANAFLGGDLVSATPTTPRMGCPATCTGYELTANLDFAADGMAVTTTDAYPNWTPIGPGYAAQFHGNGRTISNLTITGNNRNVGLFEVIDAGGAVRDLGLINPQVSGQTRLGALAAEIAGGAAVTAAYVSGGSVAVTANNTYAGGLVGNNEGDIQASYASASVDGGAYTGVVIGGLVAALGGELTAGYAYGAVTGTDAGAELGRLVGRADASGRLYRSYCDATVHGAATPCVAQEDSGSVVEAQDKTTAQLQSPTAYTGIYARWNLDVDADDFPDQPWNFGTSSQYPTLKTPMERANAPVIDYDQDNDNLIDINSLHQLNAIRHDLDGNGLPGAVGDYPAYAGAFPGGDLASTTTRMGCPATCTGYELMQSLDFAADGMTVTTTDAYPNWTPIGGSYTATFDGQGHTITRLTITGDHANAGLFHTLGNGGEIRDVGMLHASITTSAASAKAGILAAIIADGGEVITSYIQNGSITVSGANAIAGGLAGQIAGEIRAAYTTASVDAGSAASVSIGGLAGQIATGTIIASYAAGPVSGTGTGIGGFAGAVTGTSAITDSYCHTAACQPSGAGTAPQAEGALQWTDGYTGIFANWNLDLNDDNTPDYPWYFGGPTDYPVLNTPAQRTDQRTAAVVTTVDYDANDNGLIDIDSLTKLNAIRHDLDGNGLPNTPANYAAYLTAFPNGALAPAARMGCPAGNCTGYELTADLDFAADGVAVTSTDAYPNWMPIGYETAPYTAAFEGNSRSITNLTITSGSNAGLFGALGNGGIIRDLAMRTPMIHGETAAGAFAAVMGASSIISTSYVQGGMVSLSNTGNVGGLAGTLSGTIRASHASTTAIAGAHAGSNVGGLAGSITANGEIIASYAAAPVTGPGNLGGLAGQTAAGATITASYCDATVSGQDDGIGAGPVTTDCHPTGALQSPTGYSGLYAAWNLDLNGDNTPDYPWYFGTSAQYPELNTPTQRQEQRTSGDVPPPPLPRAIIPEPPKPYDPAADHPEIYENAEYEITATCETRNPDPETNEPREATITFNLGTYNGPILLALSIWTGSRYMAYETQDLPQPTLNRQGQTATLNIETNPSQTRFRLDGTRNGLRHNLVLGYANCRTN